MSLPEIGFYSYIASFCIVCMFNIWFDRTYHKEPDKRELLWALVPVVNICQAAGVLLFIIWAAITWAATKFRK